MPEYRKLKYAPIDGFPVAGYVTFKERNPGSILVNTKDHWLYQGFRAYHAACFTGLVAGMLVAISNL